MLPKQHRLSNKDFKKLFQNGEKIRGEFGMLIHTTEGSPTSPALFGFVVNKKVGNAVERHGLTRQLRSLAMDAIKSDKEMFSGKKFQYIAFKKPKAFSELKKEFENQIAKISA